MVTFMLETVGVGDKLQYVGDRFKVLGNAICKRHHHDFYTNIALQYIRFSRFFLFLNTWQIFATAYWEKGLLPPRNTSLVGLRKGQR